MSRTIPQRSPALARLCEFDLLGVEEERRLFGRLKESREQSIRSGRRAPVRRLKASRVGATALRNRIAVANLRLVVSLAKRFASPQQPLEDLVSEASILLLHCVEKFDAARGTRFSTYATRALTHHFLRLRRRERRRKMCSLTRFARHEIPAIERDNAEGAQRLIHSEDVRRMKAALAELPTRQRNLIASRFGLDGNAAPQTFQELAVSHGLSKEWARVTTADALARLRDSLTQNSRP
jgi:RNA polymerase primary sigma factor